MFAATFPMQVSSQRSLPTEIPGTWWRTAPEIDS